MPTNHTRSFLLGCAVTVAALTVPAPAGPEPLPTGAGKQAAKQTAAAQPSAGQSAEGQPTPPEGVPAEGQAEGQAEGAAQAESPTHTGPSATAVALARWVRAIGGRVCTGPKLRYGDRVSMPDVNDQAQGWRVSVPSFGAARVSAPPARAHAAKPESTETGSAEAPTDPVQTASEPGGH